MQKRGCEDATCVFRAGRKRGMSAIVATVLIVLIAIAAVIVIWAFILPLFTETGSDIDVGAFRVNMEIIPGSIVFSEQNDTVNLTVRRNAGDSVDFRGFRVVIWDIDGNSRAWLFEGGNYVLDEFGTVRVEIDNLALLGVLDKIEVIPLITNAAGDSVPAVGSDEHVVPEDPPIDPPGEPGDILKFDGTSCGGNGECESGICQAASSGPDTNLRCQPKDGYRVFVTDWTTRGNIGGISKADDRCRAFGHYALGGTWKAWISDSSSSDVRDRLYNSPVEYVNIDETVVADDWSDLTTCDPTCLQSGGIKLNEFGESVGVLGIWTSTQPNGALVTEDLHCSDWTDGSSGSGYYGQSSNQNSAWTYGDPYACNQLLRLYCFEQPSTCTRDNEGVLCDNKNACDNETGTDSCVSGVCVGGDLKDTSDENPCTDDYCDPLNGIITNIDVPAGEQREGCVSSVGDCTLEGNCVCDGAGVCINGPGDCGDGDVNFGEDCDDGDDEVPGDGCHNCWADVDLFFEGCGFSDWNEGSYYNLSGDFHWTGSGACFGINVDNVILDCKNNQITSGTGGQKHGVDIDADNVIVENCNIVVEDFPIRISTGTGNILRNNSLGTTSRSSMRINSGDNIISGNELCGSSGDGTNNLFILTGTQTDEGDRNKCDGCIDIEGLGDVCDIAAGGVCDDNGAVCGVGDLAACLDPGTARCIYPCFESC